MAKEAQIKPAVSEDLVLKNFELNKALKFYSKLCNVDFDAEQFEAAMDIAVDATKIEDALKAYSKLEKSLREKAEAKRVNGEIPVEAIEKFSADMEALSEQEVVITGGLKKVSSDIIKKVKLNPLELLAAKTKLKVLD